MPTLTIDGKEIAVEKGTNVLQACEKLGIEIPHYCYHPGLSVAGNCRICMVEIEKFPKPQISCYMPCQEGMVVRTDTEGVKKLREHVLEFLLINHPLDCPVCDQAGECRLQDYYMTYGLYDSRFNENKVKKHYKATPIGPHIMLDSERCILCSRCVRFTDEVTKTGEFGIFNRGDRSEIGIHPGKELNNAYSGCTADICPVGALTDRDFRFKCRVWYLKQSPSVCPGCSRGCNIEIHYVTDRPHIAEGDWVMRLKPRYNAEVNRWWMCDQGRYGYSSIDKNRILKVAKKWNGRSEESSWDRAAHEISSELRSLDPKTFAVLASPQLTNEELYLIRKIFKEALKFPHVYLFSPRSLGDQDDFLIRSDKNPNTQGGAELGFKVLSPEELLKGAYRGVYLFGQDLFSVMKSEHAAGFLSSLEILIFQGSNVHETSKLAHWILASSTYAEKEGTFTNCGRRVQRIARAFPSKSDSKEDLEILMLLALKLDISLSYQSAEEVFREIASSLPAFKGLSYGALGKEGALLR